MLLGARIQAVIEIVEKVTTHFFPADRACAHYFRNNRFVGSKDRLFIGNMVFDVFRYWGFLQWLLENDLSPRHSVLLFSLINKKQSLHELDQALAGSNNFIKPLNHYESDLLTKCLLRTQNHHIPSWARFNFPQWMENELKESLGNHFEREAEQFMTNAPMTLRTNVLKASREELLKAIRLEQPACQTTHFSPWGIVCHERWRADQHPAFRAGHFEVQDEASQICAFVVDAKPGEKVLDYCAGAGGKTLALAALMRNKGQLYATDIDSVKLEETQKRLRRNGVHNAQCRLLDGATHKWLAKHASTFDRVLVDAPCSGSGTWRRNPDAKWKLTPNALANLQTTQAMLLEQTHKLIKPGGYLIYSTCSFFQSENQKQIEHFLDKHKDFCPVAPNIDSQLLKGHFMQSLPSQHGMDGFFAAVLQKKG